MKKQIAFVSIEQTGYEAAKLGDTFKSIGALALDNIPEFAVATDKKDISQEVRDALNVGFRKRYNENNPPVEYAVIDGNYLQLDSLDKDVKVLEKVKIGMEFAYSMTRQEFGALKESNPKLHAVVGVIREDCNAYCSNAFGALFKKVEEIKRERRGETKTRQQALPMDEWLNDFFDTAKKRVIAAEARGDATANKKRLGEAIIAFKSKYFV